MSKVSLKGIIIGGVVDVLATNLFSLPVTLDVMAKLHAHHVPKDQLQSALLSTIHGSPLLFSVQAVIGVACSVVGGYVAALVAKKNGSLNGALSAWLCVGIGIYSIFSGVSSETIGLTMAGLVVSPLAGYSGGYLYQKTKKVRVNEA